MNKFRVATTYLSNAKLHFSHFNNAHSSIIYTHILDRRVRSCFEFGRHLNILSNIKRHCRKAVSDKSV
ncbi:MAG TPA: hypothetical protein EYG81_06175 [Archaeoglobus profundus]|nr:hypothetical protein [Archaeoglobus profundus]